MCAVERHSVTTLLTLMLVALIGTACEQDPNPLAQDTAPAMGGETAHSQHSQHRQHSQRGQRAPQADRHFYLARIAPEGGSRVRGIAQFEIVGDWFTAKVRVTGVAANHRIPQHIHLNPTCAPAGGILINLDANLTVAGEGPGVGEDYPRANPGGVLQYEARRSLEALRQAVNDSDAFDVNLGSVEELIEWLDLDSRNVNFHEPPPPPIPSVGCGEIQRVN